MADEPSPGELSRRLDGVVMSLAQLIQRAEYAADQRLIERRFTDVEGDVNELRRTLLDEVRALRGDLAAAVTRLEAADEKREEKRGGNLKQMIYSGILPTLFILLTIAVQVWLAPRGGG
ncbi:hypothetical protein ACIBI9_04250 [Nonomuraea sp. NPDC050451]|uniref:hypothetical protein n=1 Tax=Nonomuraea sp. NPDC050451 TaxID=3364364 RepID=UPI0037903C3E